MGSPAGIAAQLGLVKEATYGTPLTVTRFYEFTEESLGQEIERIESAGIRAGRRVLHRWTPGVKRVGGDVTFELPNLGLAYLLDFMFGSVVTTGAGPFTHTATPGDLLGKMATIQVGRPMTDGVVQPFTYHGCKLSEWELSCSVNEYAMLRSSWIGEDEDNATSLATPSYPVGLVPFTFVQGTFAVAGATVDVAEFTLSAGNNLAEDRHRIRGSAGNLQKQPLENGLREYTGSAAMDFESLTAYNRFVNGTEASLVLTFTAGASSSLVITANVRFDGETPKVSGPELLEQPLPYKVVGAAAGTDAAAITAVVTSTETVP